MGDPVVVFLKGGLVQDVFGVDSYQIVDWDVIDEYYNPECPICWRDLTADDMVCCGIDWAKDKISNEEVYQMIKNKETENE